MGKKNNRTYRPFEMQKHGYTCAHNVVWDCIMPLLSGNAWKILSLFIRQTSGWHEETFQIGQREIGDRLGMAKGTVASALKELTAEELPCVRLASASEGFQAATYVLNLNLIIDDAKIRQLSQERGLRILPEPGRQIVANTGSKIDPVPRGSKIDPTPGSKIDPEENHSVGQKLTRSYIDEKRKKRNNLETTPKTTSETDDLDSDLPPDPDDLDVDGITIAILDQSLPPARMRTPFGENISGAQIRLERIKRVLSRVTGMHFELNQEELRSEAYKLLKAKFRPHEIERAYSKGGYWYVHPDTWQGSKNGQRPTLRDIRRTIEAAVQFEPSRMENGHSNGNGVNTGWELALRAIQQNGRHTPLREWTGVDDQLRTVIGKVGVMRLCDMDQYNQNSLRSEFMRAYQECNLT